MIAGNQCPVSDVRWQSTGRACAPRVQVIAYKRHPGRLQGRLQVATREAETVGLQPQPQLDVTSSVSSPEINSIVSSSSGSCPFLAALPSPPPAQHKWWQRLLQLSNPPKFQHLALGPHRVVEAGSELGVPGQVLVGDGDLARVVLGGEGDVTMQGNFLKGFGALVGTQSLLAVQEPHHKYLRALIMPAFEKPAIERLVPRMEAVLSKHLARWCKETAAPGATVKALDETKTMTFDFIINVIMGRDFDEQELDSLIDTYKVWVGGLLAWPFIDLPFTRFGRSLQARQQLLRRLQVDVDSARQQQSQGQQPAGILGSLIAAVDEEGNRLTDSQVLDNLLLLLLAGHDTGAVTLTNILAELQRHPAVLERLREEQQQVVARHGPQLCGAVLRDMEYADAVIRETLRRTPVVPSLSRVAARDFELGGYAIKKGQFVVPLLHNNAGNDPRWTADEPQLFKPERMMTAEGQKPGWLMPFGYGPRFCAGYAVAMAEMKVFLALLARGYEFSADVNTQWVQRLGRVPENGLPMRITPLKTVQ